MTALFTNRQRGETDLQYYLRRYRICADRAANAWVQQQRSRMDNNRGATIFYQFECARWHREILHCRELYDQAVAEFIPGTAVRWNEMFTDRWSFMDNVQSIGRGLRVIPVTGWKFQRYAPRYFWRH